MLLTPLNELDEPKLQALCNEQCPESETIDFKRAIPRASDKDKHEFLKDISAFANASGGDLVYGISEENGFAKAIVPVTEESEDILRRRLGQILDAGLEPRIAGIKFHFINVTNGYVLIIRVPASFDAPHRYLFNNHSKFVMRTGTHITELSYAELRSAFDRTATLVEKARNFRAIRIQAVSQGKTWKPLLSGPVCVVHLISIAGMSGKKKLDIQSLYDEYQSFISEGWGSASRSLNLDGLIVYPRMIGDNKIASSNQIFRAGAFEALRYGGKFTNLESKTIPSTTVSSYFRNTIIQFLNAAKDLGLSGPAIIGISLLSVEGFEFSYENKSYWQSSALSDREHLILADEWIENIDSVTNADEIIQPILDVLWQAFDIQRCYCYDQNGNWKTNN